MKKLFAVLYDYVCDDGDSGSNVFLFHTIKKATDHLQQEAIEELENRQEYTLYYNKNKVTKSIMKKLLAKLDHKFNFTDDFDNADYVIEVTATSFVCFKQGEYSCDHICVNILERSIE
jgi:hypothetical protein